MSEHICEAFAKACTEKRVFIRSFEWPMVQVPRDDFGDSKEGKCFGVKALRLY